MERLARLVPGVGRYQDREGLRETDKQVRVHLADLLTDLERLLEGGQRRLTEAKRLDRLPALDRVARLLNTLADRLRFAGYGFAGVFDLQKIRERELAAMHRFDLDLVEAVSRLREPIRGLAERVDDEAGFAQAHQAVEAMLYDIEGRVAERDRLARGL
jgi:hypothetical protein